MSATLLKMDNPTCAQTRTTVDKQAASCAAIQTLSSLAARSRLATSSLTETLTNVQTQQMEVLLDAKTVPFYLPRLVCSVYQPQA
jgi:hypothetical protein